VAMCGGNVRWATLRTEVRPNFGAKLGDHQLCTKVRSNFPPVVKLCSNFAANLPQSMVARHMLCQMTPPLSLGVTMSVIATPTCFPAMQPNMKPFCWGGVHPQQSQEWAGRRHSRSMTPPDAQELRSIAWNTAVRLVFVVF